jgi:hypothetical protein
MHMTELGHLLLADAVHKRLQWPRDMRAALYIGAIAPDAHRATIDVSYRDVHFRSAHRQGFRLVDFLRTYLRPAARSYDLQERGFFLGWLTHLCADDVWRRKIRAEFPSLWQRISGAPRLERHALREEFHDECDWVDAQLYQRHAYLIEDIRILLQEAPARFTIPPLQLGDLQRWQSQVIEDSLPPSNLYVEQARFLSVDFVQEAMVLAEEETISMLEWEMKQKPEDGVDHGAGYFSTIA